MPCPRAFRSPGIVSPNLERAGDSGSTSEVDAATLKVCAEDPDIDPVFRKSGYLISHKKNSKNYGLCTSPDLFDNKRGDWMRLLAKDI